MKPKSLRTLSLAFALVIIPVIIYFVAISTKQSTTQKPTSIQPTKTVRQQKPPSTQNEKLVDRFENRRELPTDDIQAKKNILATLPTDQPSGTVYQSSKIRIEYNSAPDLFQVEVLTMEIDLAKNEAVTWLKSKGLSQEAICFAPVQFYASFDVLQQLKQNNIEFNPLAPGC